MLRPNDYYDDCTIFECNKTFAEIINELIGSTYTNKERRVIFMALCKDLVNTYLDED